MSENPLAPVPFTAPASIRKVALGLCGVGALLFVYALIAEPWRAWSGGLLAAYYSISVAIGAGVVVALMHVTKAGWGVVVRRVPEAMTAWLPYGLLALLLVTGFGMHSLYEWSHPDLVAEDELLQHKSALLNVPFFFARMVLILGAWTLLTRKLRRESIAQDTDGDEKHTSANLRWSAIFLVVFGLTMTLGALDWLMSLEPHWFSTMFGVYQFAGAHVAGVAVATLITLWLKQNGHLPQVTDNHLHDLGKMMFAFSTFWAYIWLSQFLLIWYANIPEETGYFLIREDGAWMAVFGINVLVNWTIPFFVLLPRPNKRSPRVLAGVAILLLCGHFLDVYLQILPATAHFAGHADPHAAHGPFFGPAEVGAFALLAGAFLIVVFRALGQASLVPTRDPYLGESLHHHQ